MDAARELSDELVCFAKKNHRGFASFEDDQVRRFFQVVKNTTLVTQQNGKIVGFAVYIERPEGLYFACIAIEKEARMNWRAVPIMMEILEHLPDCPILWHDNKMRLHKWRK